MKCYFPNCDSIPMHRHHVTYTPPVIKPLCEKHHADITIINGIAARRQNRYGEPCGTLSNRYRWFLWYSWLDGEIKPRRTKKAMEHLKNWKEK